MIRSGYQGRPEPLYFDDVDGAGGVTWQPDVYAHAAKVAAALQAGTIIDFGCGRALKLVPLADRFRIIGIDFGPNIAWCRAHHPVGEWIEHDFHSTGPVTLKRTGAAVVVCADVVEHVRDPARLARKLRATFRRGARAILVSTPEREITHGPYHDGPPPNPHHVREWSIREFGVFMRDQGFKHTSLGLTRNNDEENFPATILAACAKRARTLRRVEQAIIDSDSR
jgi:hypothetical protein